MSVYVKVICWWRYTIWRPLPIFCDLLNDDSQKSSSGHAQSRAWAAWKDPPLLTKLVFANFYRGSCTYFSQFIPKLVFANFYRGSCTYFSQFIHQVSNVCTRGRRRRPENTSLAEICPFTAMTTPPLFFFNPCRTRLPAFITKWLPRFSVCWKQVDPQLKKI